MITKLHKDCGVMDESAYLDHLVEGGAPVVSDDADRLTVRVLRALKHFDGARLDDLLIALDLPEDASTKRTLQRELAELAATGFIVRSGPHAHYLYRLARRSK